jgi:hypothetical protein
VADGVVKGFFDSQEEVMTNFAGSNMVGKGIRDLDMAGDVDLSEEFFGVAGEVSGDRGEVVSFGVDGPDDFVESVNEGAGLAGDGLHAFGGLVLREGEVRVGGGEHGDFGEAAAEVVVEVASDAGSFLGEGVLVFSLFAVVHFFLELSGALPDFEPEEPDPD